MVVSLALGAGAVTAQQTAADTVKQQCASAKSVAEFWHGFRSADQANVLNNLAAEFNKTQKDGCVLPIVQGSYGDLSTKLKAGFAAGKVPAMAQAFENNIALYLEAKKLADLSALGVRTQGLQKNLVEAANFDGVQYGLPFNKTVQVMYYNKDLFGKQGVKVPGTITEFAAAARELSRKSGAPAWWFQPTASTFGALFYSLGGDYGSGATVTLNSPTAVRALQLMVDLTREGAAKPILSGFINSQLNDTYGMSLDTSAGFPFYTSGAKFNLGVAPLPGLRRGVPGTAVIQGTNVVVFKDAPKAQQELAARFLNFAMQPRNSAIFATAIGTVPSNDLASRQPVFMSFVEKNPNYAAVLRQARFAKYEPRIADWEQIRFQVLEKAIGEAVAGRISAREALDRAQKQAEDLLAGRRK